MDVNCVVDLLRCSESLRSMFDNVAAPDNRKISIYDQIYLARNERSCADEFLSSLGKATVTPHDLFRLRSTLLMRRLVIDEESGIFSLGTAVDSLAAADGFVFDRMRYRSSLLRVTRRKRPSRTSIFS